MDGGWCRTRTCATSRSRRLSTALPFLSANHPNLERATGLEPAWGGLEDRRPSIGRERKHWMRERESNPPVRFCRPYPNRLGLSPYWQPLPDLNREHLEQGSSALPSEARGNDAGLGSVLRPRASAAQTRCSSTRALPRVNWPSRQESNLHAFAFVARCSSS
jgi:hypothetical protein